MKASIKSVFIGVMAMLLALLLVSCGKSVEERWQEQYDLGQKYLQELDYEQALIAFTNAIEIDSKNVDAYLGRAQAYMGLGDYDNARSDYEFVLTLAPEMEPDVQKLLEEMESATDDAGTEEDSEDSVDWRAQGQQLLEQYKNTAYLSFYVSDAQREEKLRPAVEQFRNVIEHDLDNYEPYSETVSNIYILLGDAEGLLDFRSYIYNTTGDEKYNPAGYDYEMGEGQIAYYNEYGICIGNNNGFSRSIDEHLRITKESTNYSGHVSTVEYEYSDDGRIARTLFIGSYNIWDDYVYQDNTVTFTHWSDPGTYYQNGAEGDTYLEFDEFGCAVAAYDKNGVELDPENGTATDSTSHRFGPDYRQIG